MRPMSSDLTNQSTHGSLPTLHELQHPTAFTPQKRVPWESLPSHGHESLPHITSLFHDLVMVTISQHHLTPQPLPTPLQRTPVPATTHLPPSTSSGGSSSTRARSTPSQPSPHPLHATSPLLTTTTPAASRPSSNSLVMQ